MELFQNSPAIVMSEDEIFKLILFLVIAFIYGIGWVITAIKKAAVKQRQKLEQQSGGSSRRRQASAPARPLQSVGRRPTPQAPPQRPAAGAAVATPAREQPANQQVLEMLRGIAGKPADQQMLDLVRELSGGFPPRVEAPAAPPRPQPMAEQQALPSLPALPRLSAPQSAVQRKPHGPQQLIRSAQQQLKPEFNLRKVRTAAVIVPHGALSAPPRAVRRATVRQKQDRPVLDARQALIHSIIFSQPRFKRPPGYRA